MYIYKGSYEDFGKSILGTFGFGKGFWFLGKINMRIWKA